ncbi:MAG: UDP-3-O-(3-hydroxymyristoyl)glucosamine N-acyltransferase [Planctomycetota bacterium]
MPFQATAADLAKIVDGAVLGDASLELIDLVSIEHAMPGELTFYASQKYQKFLATTQASALLMVKGTPEIQTIRQSGKTVIEVADPFASYIKLCHWIVAQQDLPVKPGVHPSAIVAQGVQVPASAHIGPYAIVETGVTLGENVRIDAYAYVGPQCRIGAGSRIRSHAALVSPCTIGKNCDIQVGVVVGADGLAISKAAGEEGALSRIPQLGDVVIEDNCQIGANTVIERAALGHTRIGADTKIDVTVVIGHGDQLGKKVRICALSGLAGSVTVEDNVLLGGHCGIGDHLTIGKNTMMASSFVGSDIPPNSVFAGHPGRPYKEWLRENYALKKLPDTGRDVRELKRQVAELTARLAELEKHDRQ